jgi:hypothetical protein
MPRDEAQEVPAVPVRPVHHRRHAQAIFGSIRPKTARVTLDHLLEGSNAQYLFVNCTATADLE